MARTVKEYRLERRAERARLQSRNEPYWRSVSEGLHLGYYRGKRVGKWVCRFRSPGSKGGYQKETLGAADDVAEADGVSILSYGEAVRAAQAWHEALIGSDGERPRPLTVGQVLDEYLNGFNGRGIVDTRSRVNAILRPAFGDLDVSKLTTKRIRDWHDARGKSPAKLRTARGAKSENLRPAGDPEAIRKRRATANRDLTVLKAALNKAATDRKWMQDVWSDVQAFANVDVARRRFLSDEETSQLVNAAEDGFQPMVRAALLTGGRYGELRHAEVRDYDRASATLWLAEVKGVEPRPAYLDPAGVELIEAQIEGKRPSDLIFCRPDGLQWKQSQQRRRMIAAFEKAEISAVTYHDLRRTYGARLARQGVPLAMIAEALGHKDERITKKHYAHLAPSHVSKAIRAAISGILGSQGSPEVKR